VLAEKLLVAAAAPRAGSKFLRSAHAEQRLLGRFLRKARDTGSPPLSNLGKKHNAVSLHPLKILSLFVPVALLLAACGNQQGRTRFARRVSARAAFPSNFCSTANANVRHALGPPGIRCVLAVHAAELAELAGMRPGATFSCP